MKSITKYLFIALVLMNLSMAQETVSDYSIEFGVSNVERVDLQIRENGYVDVVKRLTLSDETAGVIIPYPVENLKVLDRNDEEIVYTTQDINNRKLIKFLGGKGNQVRITYSTSQLISKNGSRWSIRYITSATPGLTLVQLNFLPNTRILPLPRDILFSPIENGLILYPDSTIFSFEIDYETQQEGIKTFIGFENVIVLLSLGLFVVVAYFWISGRESKESTEEETDMKGEEKESKIVDSIKNTLDENERKIVEILEGSDDEITQAYIYKSTGIPKSSLSEIMNRLEKRNIIKRRKDGRTKWIKLRKWIFE